MEKWQSVQIAADFVNHRQLQLLSQEEIEDSISQSGNFIWL